MLLHRAERYVTASQGGKVCYCKRRQGMLLQWEGKYVTAPEGKVCFLDGAVRYVTARGGKLPAVDLACHASLNIFGLFHNSIMPIGFKDHCPLVCSFQGRLAAVVLKLPQPLFFFTVNRVKTQSIFKWCPSVYIVAVLFLYFLLLFFWCCGFHYCIMALAMTEILELLMFSINSLLCCLV